MKNASSSVIPLSRGWSESALGTGVGALGRAISGNNVQHCSSKIHFGAQRRELVVCNKVLDCDT